MSEAVYLQPGPGPLLPASSSALRRSNDTDLRLPPLPDGDVEGVTEVKHHSLRKNFTKSAVLNLAVYLDSHKALFNINKVLRLPKVA